MSSYDYFESIRKPKVFRCFQRDQEGTLGKKVNHFLVFLTAKKIVIVSIITTSIILIIV